MIRPAMLLAPLCAALLAGGCGGSSRSGTSAASPASSTTSTPASVAVQSSTTTTTSSTSTSSAKATHSGTARTTSTTTATARHDGAPARSPGDRGTGSGGSGRHYPRLPATFTITPGGTLAPTAVSLPAVDSVALAIRSEDGRIRHVVLRMPAHAAELTVPPHGRASAVLHGIKPGRYVVDVDGLARGIVLVGGIPGSR